MTSHVVKARVCRGFTLVEVIVTLTVMSLMMVGLLSYVHSGSMLWQRGQNSLTVRTYYRAVSESIERDLSQAIILHNDVGSVESSLKYDLPVTQGIVQGTATIDLVIVDKKLMRLLKDASGGFTITNGNSALDNMLVRSRYEYTVARNVATFTVTRSASYSVQINLGLISVLAGANDGVESVKNATLTYILPSGR